MTYIKKELKDDIVAKKKKRCVYIEGMSHCLTSPRGVKLKGMKNKDRKNEKRKRKEKHSGCDYDFSW